MRHTSRYAVPRFFSISASLLTFTSLILTGCSGGILSVPTENAQAVSGNWQISSTASAAGKLPMLSGELTGSASAVTGILHPAATASCAAPETVIDVSGHVDDRKLLTLTGEVAGGMLTVAGTLSADGKSLTGASYNVAGGSCAFTAKAAATAQSYSSVTGTYSGNFSDAGGNVIGVVAQLTQTPDSDTSGNFTLSGTGTFPDNPCFSSPVTLSSAQVTGGSFTLTYNDPNLANSVTATGTFSTDAITLTVTNWTLSGSCGPDMGTGLLTHQ